MISGHLLCSRCSHFTGTTPTCLYLLCIYLPGKGAQNTLNSLLLSSRSSRITLLLCLRLMSSFWNYFVHRLVDHHTGHHACPIYCDTLIGCRSRIHQIPLTSWYHCCAYVTWNHRCGGADGSCHPQQKKGLSFILLSRVYDLKGL